METKKESVAKTLGKILLVSIVWLFLYFFILSYFELNANPSSIYKLAGIYLVGQGWIIYNFFKKRNMKEGTNKSWKWVYVLGAILGVIILFYIIFPSEEQTTNETNEVELMKSHIVYVIYDFSYKDESGSLHNAGATGSGVIFYKDSSRIEIFTNRHVIDCGYTNNCYQRVSENVKVRMPDGKIYNVSQVSVAPHGLDISVLRIDGNNFESYSETLVRRENLQLGDKVVAIGYPAIEGINNVREFSVSEGKVTGFNDLLMADGFSFKSVDSDAYINHGSSGGGLFDSEGNLVGITTWKSLNSKEGTAISINVIDDFDSYYYCQKGTYLEGDKCKTFCKESEVLGTGGTCYKACDDFYCLSTEFDVNDQRCSNGLIAGQDGYCHQPCESPSTYCMGNGYCYKNRCTQCPSPNTILYEDGLCR